jgi:hypothetical protein
MKTAIVVVMAAATLTGIPLLAQDSNTDPNASPSGNDSAKMTYAPAAGGFGDLAASHAWEMSVVTGELEGKLDSKTAKVGDRVVLKTAEKVQTSDGTVIPRGSRLVGHVTEVQAYDLEIGFARIAVAFDHAELKNGQSIAVYTLIRGVSTSIPALTVGQEDQDSMMGMPVPAAAMANGTRLGGPGYYSTAPGYATSQVDRVSDAAVAERKREEANQGSTPGSTGSTTTQGGGGSNTATGAHGVAAARAVPHPTNIRGVMLAGNSTSSGVLLNLVKDIQLESGTQIQLGVVADR